MLITLRASARVKRVMMILGWLSGFSMLLLALTRPVRAGPRLHQIRSKDTPWVWSVRVPTRNTHIQDRLIDILLTIRVDVKEAKIQENMSGSSQFMSMDEDRVGFHDKEDETRRMKGTSGKKEGLQRDHIKMLSSDWYGPKGEESIMKNKRHRLSKSSRRKNCHRIKRKMSLPSCSKLEDRRQCLRRALLGMKETKKNMVGSSQFRTRTILNKKEIGPRIMKRNAMFSK